MTQNPYLLTESPEGEKGEHPLAQSSIIHRDASQPMFTIYAGHKMIYIRSINSHAGYLGFKMVEEPEAQHASCGTASLFRLPEGDFRYVSTIISNMGKPGILVRNSSVRRSTRE